MSGRLNGRLQRLESGLVKPCEECGFDGDLSKAEIVVLWEDLDGEVPEEEGPQFCPECGHQWVYDITWEDLPNEGEERQL
jgi:predicted RNA-binding Zn-ribbon protein involved in translation (DUF1610 family)